MLGESSHEQYSICALQFVVGRDRYSVSLPVGAFNFEDHSSVKRDRPCVHRRSNAADGAAAKSANSLEKCRVELASQNHVLDD
jgi:hypothetical protein